MQRAARYEQTPCVDLPGTAEACVRGWDAIAARLHRAVEARGARKTVLTLECYPGVREAEVADELTKRLPATTTLLARDALRDPARIVTLVDPYLGDDDPVFGRLSPLKLPEFFDPERVRDLRGSVERSAEGLVLVVGCGASLIAAGDLLVYADLPRWEAQLRFRRQESGNLGVPANAFAATSASEKYKRAFFVDWRVADRWKRPLMDRWDFVLDTSKPGAPKLAEGAVIRRGLSYTVTRPFRVVPFFDPAPWGGQWMKSALDLPPEAPNYGWGFDCVPEENSLLLGLGNERFEMPSLNLVFAHPERLLGEAVHGRFGAEFPIRFDFLDTMSGGNLSLQVHPLTEYIQQAFGMHYTQDESYYILEAAPGAVVYLGFCEFLDRAAFVRDLRDAHSGGLPFPAELHAQRWPARKHDHFLIPAGTIHCAGAGSVVLEISATPYIFTFKLWDWGRLGLDGRPRPIHLDHGLANLQWDRRSRWTQNNLINVVTERGRGYHWREERTGLHPREFIETRRHWFTGPVPHHTEGGVNVLNLVEGEAAMVESPTGAFAPFPISYAETFIVPAEVGAYTVRPLAGSSTGTKSAPRELATMKAYVRT